MANQLQNAISQGSALWGRLPAKKRAVVAAAVVGSVVFLFYILTGTTVAEYSVLYSDVRPEEASSILANLRKENILYKLGDDGRTILVPKDKIHEIRIDMAQSGGPAGFELFDKQAFGTTSFVEQINYRRALQGELVRTITAIDAIERARVHLALSKRSLFRNEEEAPSASVIVHTRPGVILSSRQVSGIVHLVSSSVESLSPDRVSVVDQRGNVLSSGDQEGLEQQRELEATLARRIRTIVERFVGAGHIVVEVTAELNREQVDQTKETYDKDNTVLRSETHNEERTGGKGSSSAGVAGARGNLPGAASPTSTGGGDGLRRLSQTRNYEVNRVISRIKGPKVRIKRLHVAIVVDGVPPPVSETDDPTSKNKRKSKRKGKGKGKQDSTVTQVPRSKEELARIEALAREAAGLDPSRGDRIEVHSVPFVAPQVLEEIAPSKPASWLSPRLMVIAGVGLVIIILLVLVLRSLGKQANNQESHLLPTLPATVGQIEASLPAANAPTLALAAPEASTTAPAVAAQNTEKAARMLSSWLAEPGGTS